MNLSKTLTPEMKKKDPKYAAALVVRKAKKKWNEAVKEALEVQQLTIEERNERFAPKKKRRTERTKRKFSTDFDKPNVKRTKPNNVLSKFFHYFSMNLIVELSCELYNYSSGT